MANLSPSGSRGAVPRGPRARALRQLRTWFADGTLAPGERIPSEHDLAGRLDIARKTVRAALAELQEEGLIDHRGLSGRFVAGAATAAKRPLNEAVAVVTELDDELGDVRIAGSLSAIDAGLLLGMRDHGMVPLLLHPRRFAADAEVAERLAAFAGFPPRALVLGGSAHRLGDARLGQLIAAARKARVPIAAYGDEPLLADCDRVVSDHAVGCRLLCETLFARGCRRILRLWEPGAPGTWLAGRDRGYEQAHAAARIAPQPHVPPLPGTHDPELPLEVRARLIAASLLDRLPADGVPTGLLAISDSAAFPAIAASRLLGRELAIAGYDAYWQDRPEHRLTGDRPVASIDKRNRECGSNLADILYDRLRGALPAAARCVVVPPTLSI